MNNVLNDSQLTELGKGMMGRGGEVYCNCGQVLYQGTV